MEACAVSEEFQQLDAKTKDHQLVQLESGSCMLHHADVVSVMLMMVLTVLMVLMLMMLVMLMKLMMLAMLMVVMWCV